MKYYIDKYKPTLIVLGIVVLLITIVTVPTIIISRDKEDKEYFPTYEKITVKKKDVVDKTSENYSTIKKQLEKDDLFAKEALISNYSYKTYTSADLEDMVWNFIFSYELSNTRNLSSIDYSSGTFCMRSHYVIEAFEELYGVKITTDLPLLPGYYEYVHTKGDKYCFNFGNVGRDYDNQILVAVEDMSIDSDIIKANIYRYEYYSSGTSNEKTYISNLKSCINSSNYNSAYSTVIDNLKGKVTHKQLSFRIHNNGEFYKYQILQSKNLSY